MLTQSRLKELLHYNPLTGVFTYSSPRRKIQVGNVAGTPHRRGYLAISIDRKTYLAHRLAWLYINGNFPEFDIDHENHVKTDNRIANLVEKTKAENNKNLPLRKKSKSGVTGVRWVSKHSRWCARIHPNGQEIHLGNFKTKEEAVSARKTAEALHGFHPNHGKT